MKKFKPFTFFLFLFTVLFLIFAPALIRSGLKKDNPSVKNQGFRGILSLWQVNGWQPGASSIGAYLKKCVTRFENKNVYVFIEVTTLTPAKAAERIRAGELPDMISFPTGFFADPSLLSPLDDTAYSSASLASSCEYGGKQYAFAFLVNPYLLFCNEDILYEKEIETETMDKLSLDTLFKTASTLSYTKQEGKKTKQIYGMAQQEEYITSPFASLAFFRDPQPPKTDTPDAATPQDTQTLSGPAYAITAAPQKGLELFMNRQAAFLISPASALSTLKNSDKSPPAYRACAFSAYSDMVQYLGIVKTEDKAKLSICKSFLYSLLNEKNVKSASDILCLPVTYSGELFTEEPVLKEAYQTLIQEGVFPNAFTYAKAHSELKPYAAGALQGDSESLSNIRRLLSKKLYS
jgi:hypothetical protein